MKHIRRSKPGTPLSPLRMTGIISGVATILIALSACLAGYDGNMETLTIAIVPNEINAPFYTAETQKFFAANGLQVTLKEEYDSGATATAGMLNGEADIASAAEFLIVRHAFSHKDIVSFGTVAKYENTFIIWHAESGIKTIRDLDGLKIGVTLGTISEFYLGRTLELNGMNIQQVDLVDVRVADGEKALLNREVDAVVTWEPWVTQINNHLGKEAITSALQSNQSAYWNLVATTDWIRNHPGTITRLIHSLSQAEDYIASHPAEVKAMVGKRLNLDAEYMEMVWKRYQFALTLDQSLIAAMEDEARWMINNNLTSETQVPDFLEYIYPDGLEAVKPEAVNIIR